MIMNLLHGVLKWCCINLQLKPKENQSLFLEYVLFFWLERAMPLGYIMACTVWVGLICVHNESWVLLKNL